jgi:hypothetical protein
VGTVFVFCPLQRRPPAFDAQARSNRHDALAPASGIICIDLYQNAYVLALVGRRGLPEAYSWARRVLLIQCRRSDSSAAGTGDDDETANDGAVLAHASGGCGHDGHIRACADEQHEWTADRRTTSRTAGGQGRTARQRRSGDGTRSWHGRWQDGRAGLADAEARKRNVAARGVGGTFASPCTNTAPRPP